MKHIAACTNSTMESQSPVQGPSHIILPTQSDPPRDPSDSNSNPDPEQGRDEDTQQATNAQLEKFDREYELTLARNAYEMEWGPLCVCQLLPWDEALREPVGLKTESPRKKGKNRYWPARFRKRQYQRWREQRRIENYGRLF